MRAPAPKAMNYDTEHDLILPDETLNHASPPDLVLTDLVLASLRRFLAARGLSDYVIFLCDEPDLYDIDKHLKALGETDATWEVLTEDHGALSIEILGAQEKEPEWRHGGCLHLRRHQMVLANWRWLTAHDGSLKEFWLYAAPSSQHYMRLRKQVRKLRRLEAAAVWQVVSGPAWRDGPRTAREAVSIDDLVLPESLRRRIDVDVIRFFDEKVATLYASLNVPYRRGILLHGPPGNGKTSLIRTIGAALPRIPVLILRPVGEFTSSQLEHVLRRWTRQAPSILVIEDLNWLLQSIDVSLLLNLLDGIDSRVSSGGLMLIATTNYPELLDPALNNRPGRFDVVIEIPQPDDSAREQFLRARLPGIDPTLAQRLVRSTDRLSFAHLEELLRTSGLLAIHAGRTDRTEEDLLTAANSLRESAESARRGFPIKSESGFGLEHLRKLARQRTDA